MKRAVFISILLVIAVILGLWQLSNARSFQFFGEIVAEITCSDSIVALTFDDGLCSLYTDEVLAILREKEVKATFFVTGLWTEKNIDIARRIVAEGHELGNHSYSHTSLVLKGLALIREEIERTDAAIRNAGHQGNIYFRPPYGKKLFMLPWYLTRSNRTTVMWSVEPELYREVAKDANRITTHVLEHVQPGAIILMHLMYDSRRESRKALPLIIDSLRERGYEFLTISELIDKDNT